MRNFRNYDIWIDGMELVNNIYDLVNKFPKDERFALISQMTRSAVSIPSNIAEGASRNSERDFGRFLEMSLGSAFELETQIRISERRKYIGSDDYSTVIEELNSLQKRISALRISLMSKEEN